MKKFLIIFDIVFNGALISYSIIFFLVLMVTNHKVSNDNLNYLSKYEHKKNIIYYNGLDISYNTKYNILEKRVLCFDETSIVYKNDDTSIIIETYNDKKILSNIATYCSDYYKKNDYIYYRYNNLNKYFKYDIINQQNSTITKKDYYSGIGCNLYLFDNLYPFDYANNRITIDTIKEFKMIKDMNINVYSRNFICKYEVFCDEIYLCITINDYLGLVLKYDYMEDKLDYYDWLYMPPSTFDGFKFYIFEDDYPLIINKVNF